MAKRFTDTEKWKDAWFRKLSPVHKCLWQYLVDECDCAGTWKVDIELASFQIGAPITSEESLAALGERVCVIGAGDRWFIRKFVVFQYGPSPKPGVNTHASVMRILSQMSLPWSTLDQHPPNPCPRDLDMDMDKDSSRESAEREAQQRKFKSLLASLLVADGSTAIRKWWALAGSNPRAVTFAHRCDLVTWCIAAARSHGVTVNYASDALPFAAGWTPIKSKQEKVPC